ncbi:MAG: hypothetical protein WKF77_01110 [Planctomycetaceae bacterium]
MNKPKGDEFVLTRTGELPARLTGKLIIGLSSQKVNNRDRNRWHEIDIIVADSGKYVAHVRWRSEWKGETNHDTCIVTEDADKLADELRDYDPLGHLMGFPDGAQFESKQQRLEEFVERDWDDLLTKSFTALGVSEEI